MRAEKLLAQNYLDWQKCLGRCLIGSAEILEKMKVLAGVRRIIEVLLIVLEIFIPHDHHLEHVTRSLIGTVAHHRHLELLFKERQPARSLEFSLRCNAGNDPAGRREVEACLLLEVEHRLSSRSAHEGDQHLPQEKTILVYLLERNTVVDHTQMERIPRLLEIIAGEIHDAHVQLGEVHPRGDHVDIRGEVDEQNNSTYHDGDHHLGGDVTKKDVHVSLRWLGFLNPCL